MEEDAGEQGVENPEDDISVCMESCDEVRSEELFAILWRRPVLPGEDGIDDSRSSCKSARVSHCAVDNPRCSHAIAS